MSKTQASEKMAHLLRKEGRASLQLTKLTLESEVEKGGMGQGARRAAGWWQ